MSHAAATTDPDVCARSHPLEHWETDDADVSATAPYTTNQTLVLESGVVEVSFLLTLHDDREFEPDERFAVRLRGARFANARGEVDGAHDSFGAPVLGAQKAAIITLVDDDAPRTGAAGSWLHGEWATVAGELRPWYVTAAATSGPRMLVGGDVFYSEVRGLILPRLLLRFSVSRIVIDLASLFLRFGVRRS